MIGWAPDLFDFMAIVSILLYKKMEVNSNRKVSIILVTTSNIWKIRLELKVVTDWQK